MKFTTEIFILKSRAIHGDIYDYDLVDYKNIDTKVPIICKIHGEFLQSPYHHINRKAGCPVCKGNRISLRKRMSVQTFVDKANIKHNNLYTYEKVKYTNAHTKIIITCKKHGDFLQTPNNHIYGPGCGCPTCKNNCVSKNATKWLDSFGLNLIREYRIPNSNYIADGYDSETNTIYEYLGKFWHGYPLDYDSEDINPIRKITYGELHRLTFERLDQIKHLGYNLIYIWGD